MKTSTLFMIKALLLLATLVPPATATSTTATRIAELRAQLGFSKFNINPKIYTLGIEEQRVNRFSSATYFKKALDDGRSALAHLDRLSKPVEFDPSDFPWETQDKILAARIKRLNETIGQSMMNSLGDYIRGVVVPARTETINNACSSPALSEKSQAVKKIIAEYIATNQPKATKSIESLLGSIQALEYDRGHVVRILMADCSGKNSEGVNLGVGLLASMITGDDAYFIEVQQYFLRTLAAEINSIEKDEDLSHGTLGTGKSAEKMSGHARAVWTALLKEALDITTQKLEKSQAVNKTMMTLSAEQQRFLVDMMIQLLGQTMPLHSQLAETQAKIEASSKTNQPPNIRQFLDYEAAKRLSQELDFLSDYLAQQKSGKTRVKEILRNIGVGQ